MVSSASDSVHSLREPIQNLRFNRAILDDALRQDHDDHRLVIDDREEVGCGDSCRPARAGNVSVQAVREQVRELKADGVHDGERVASRCMWCPGPDSNRHGRFRSQRILSHID